MPSCFLIEAASPLPGWRVRQGLRDTKAQTLSELSNTLLRRPWLAHDALSVYEQTLLIAGAWWSHFGLLSTRQIHEIVSWSHSFLETFATNWEAGRVHGGYDYVWMNETWVACVEAGWPAPDVTEWLDIWAGAETDAPTDPAITTIIGSLPGMVFAYQRNLKPSP